MVNNGKTGPLVVAREESHCKTGAFPEISVRERSILNSKELTSTDATAAEKKIARKRRKIGAFPAVSVGGALHTKLCGLDINR